jgi:hypothetical protein
MSESKNKGGRQRLSLHLLAVAGLLTIGHGAIGQVLPGPDAIPFVAQDAKDRWQRYVLAKRHKAYAVSETGAWTWKQGFATEEEAKAAALRECERYGSPCFLYAVNHSILWDKGKFPKKPGELPAADALPYVDQAAKDKWQAYVDASAHKAYAVAEDGSWAWKSGANSQEIARTTALNACESRTFPCYLYAVNGMLVWGKTAPGEALKGRVSPLEGTKLVVGRSTFAVPEGAWIVGSSQTRPSGDTSNPVVEAYGHWFGPDGQFKAAFFHSASRASVSSDAATGPAWRDGACSRTDAIITDPMHADAKSPECLLLDFVTTPEAASGYDGKIWRWVRANGVEVRIPVISSTYVKYSGADFVRIVYWINPAALRVPSLAQGIPSGSTWNPRHLDARFVERLKAWSYGMAESGRASLEVGVPTLEALPAFPVPD